MVWFLSNLNCLYNLKLNSDVRQKFNEIKYFKNFNIPILDLKKVSDNEIIVKLGESNLIKLSKYQKKVIREINLKNEIIGSFFPEGNNNLIASTQYNISKLVCDNKRSWKVQFNIETPENYSFMEGFPNSNLLLLYSDSSSIISLWKTRKDSIDFFGKSLYPKKIKFLELSKFTNEFLILSIDGKIIHCNPCGKMRDFLYSNENSDLNEKFHETTCLHWKKSDLCFLGNNMNQIIGYDMRTKNEKLFFTGHTSPLVKIDSYTVESYTSQIFSLDKSGTFKIWDLRMNREFKSIRLAAGKFINFSI
mmetsp:Transcript_42504/g.66578  ORF Transcript_42504/g.66578 Transcript_42504/m.66578 type:complete len:305 (+) Transcript_42504:1474-2388(+)